MNLNQLEYFVSVAECHSFTGAAKKHFVTQTAVTQQIQLLEEEMGIQLFDRGHRPVQLTQAGESLYLDVKSILSRTKAAIHKAKLASSAQSGSLRVGYIKGYERSPLSKRLCQFHRENPNILITCYRRSNDELMEGLESGEYDIVYTWSYSGILSKENIEGKEMEHSRLAVALYPNHPLADRVSLTRADLKGEPFIYVSASDDFPTISDAYYLNLYHGAGYEPDVLFYSVDMESVFMMVSMEEGISIVPTYISDKLGNADNLTFVPLVGKNEQETIVAAWLKQSLNPALEAFLQYALHGE